MQALDEDVYPPIELPVRSATDVVMGGNEKLVDAQPKPKMEPPQQEAYVRALKQVGLISCCLQDTHTYRRELLKLQAETSSSSSKNRIRKVMKSVAMLENNLPINWETSVHVAIDEDRQDVMRVLVLPNQDTPYANGAFIFDMWLPDRFPEVPPKVRFSLCDSTCGGKHCARS
jgi:hypothetical protein